MTSPAAREAYRVETKQGGEFYIVGPGDPFAQRKWLWRQVAEDYCAIANAAVEAAMAVEREACAKVADCVVNDPNRSAADLASLIALAIRARGRDG